jgi:hypothetical protein
VAAAAALADERLQRLLSLRTRGMLLAAGGRAFTADRRHWRLATARAVKTTAMRATKKARGARTMRVRATRVMTKTSPREEGDDGHNNQKGAKAVATARTVVATTARAITMAAKAMAIGAKRATETTG